MEGREGNGRELEPEESARETTEGTKYLDLREEMPFARQKSGSGAESDVGGAAEAGTSEVLASTTSPSKGWVVVAESSCFGIRAC